MFHVFPALSKSKHCYSSSLFSLNLIHTLSSSPISSNLKSLSVLLQGRSPLSHLLQIHAQIFRIGADQDDLIATRLIGRYSTQFALRVFHILQKPNIFPFNAIIRVLAEDGLLIQSFSIFKILKFQSFSPNDFTFSFLLKACFRSNNSQSVQQIHTHIVKSGFDCNSFVCNGLLAVYANGVRDLASGRKVFDEMPDRSMVSSWTCLIAGYAQLGQSEEALILFLQMVRENLRPEDNTMVSVLSACSSLEIFDIKRWEKVFSEFGENDDIKDLSLESINTVLIYLYGKCGKVEKSREAFDKIVDRGGRRSVLPWNAMIGGYVQNGCPMEALNLFQSMVSGCHPIPNHVTMVNMLTACAQVGDLDLGRWIHRYMKTNGSKGILESNPFLATAFIDMYSKCGSLESAREVFDRIVAKDVVSFNAMIMGLAMNGEGEEAVRLFSRMELFGVHPDGGTFLGVLCACNHSGLVREGRQIFLKMGARYSITPKLEHYACYVDLLARVGHVEEAFEFVTSMPVEPNSQVWGALLGGCLIHSRVEWAPNVAKRLVEVDHDNSAGYVMLSNAYAVDGRWGRIAELRRRMREKRVRKQPGCSWISVNQTTK